MSQHNRKLQRDLGLATAVLVLLAGASMASADTFFVRSQADDVDDIPGNGDCNTPGIFNQCTLRAAIMESNARVGGPHTIVLEPGEYVLTLRGAGEDFGEKGDLDIRNNAHIVVEGTGRATIRGDAGWNDRIFDLHPAVVVEMRDLVLENGNVAGSGGAIRNPGTLTLDGVFARSNAASADGGAILNSGRLAISGSFISGNRAGGDGGGIANFGKLALTSSHVDGNVAGSEGGGLFNAAGAFASLKRATASGNRAQAGGGGIRNLGTLETEDFVIDANQAADGGGLHSSGKATLSRTTISRNQGRGIFNGGSGATIDLENCTISGNRHVAAAAMLNRGATATLNNVTVSRNVATGVAAATGGILNVGDVAGVPAAVLELSNTILAGNVNRGGFGDCQTNVSPIVSLGFNLIGSDGGCSIIPQTGDRIGTPQAPLDPLLKPLARAPGARTETHALDAGSLAIDAGNDQLPVGSGRPACAARDQNVQQRPVDGNGDSVAVCDIGAVELVRTGLLSSEQPLQR